MRPILNVSDFMRAFDERKRTPVRRSPRMESAIRYATLNNLPRSVFDRPAGSSYRRTK
jgi:hypothetical protein